MKKVLFIVIAALLSYGFLQEQNISLPGASAPGQNAETTLQRAYQNQQSDLQVQGQGRVVRILPDDLVGSRHQRFILQLGSGQTLLIAHNIDLAAKIPGLAIGDTVDFYGEYEWADKGGVIHWTHHDPNHKHLDGWLKHRGKTYR